MNIKIKAGTRSIIALCIAILGFTCPISAQNNPANTQALSAQAQSIVAIAAFGAKGDLSGLKKALNTGLEVGLTISEIKEVLLHLYAYAGFPRSIRGLQTFMEVVSERTARGIQDEEGAAASPITGTGNKYDRGKRILSTLTGTLPPDSLTGYGAFAPTMDTFLKEHLFADIFERDVLTYAQRELVTVSVLSTIGGVEPMLRSHLSICLQVGWKPEGLRQMVQIIKKVIGKQAGRSAQAVLDEVISKRQ